MSVICELCGDRVEILRGTRIEGNVEDVIFKGIEGLKIMKLDKFSTRVKKLALFLRKLT